MLEILQLYICLIAWLLVGSNFIVKQSYRNKSNILQYFTLLLQYLFLSKSRNNPLSTNMYAVSLAKISDAMRLILIRTHTICLLSKVLVPVIAFFCGCKYFRIARFDLWDTGNQFGWSTKSCHCTRIYSVDTLTGLLVNFFLSLAS